MPVRRPGQRRLAGWGLPPPIDKGACQLARPAEQETGQAGRRRGSLDTSWAGGTHHDHTAGGSLPTSSWAFFGAVDQSRSDLTAKESNIIADRTRPSKLAPKLAVVLLVSLVSPLHVSTWCQTRSHCPDWQAPQSCPALPCPVPVPVPVPVLQVASPHGSRTPRVAHSLSIRPTQFRSGRSICHSPPASAAHLRTNAPTFPRPPLPSLADLSIALDLHDRPRAIPPPSHPALPASPLTRQLQRYPAQVTGRRMD